jgi:cell division transport system ATP-binding protein
MSEFVLSLKDVTIYQDGKAVLSEVNLDIKHGEFLYIIGKTGSGKSSFMKTLYGDLPLVSGDGKIVDFELNGLTDNEIPFLRLVLFFRTLNCFLTGVCMPICCLF